MGEMSPATTAGAPSAGSTGASAPSAPAPSSPSSATGAAPVASANTATASAGQPSTPPAQAPAPEPMRFDVAAHGDALVELEIDGRKHVMPVKEALRVSQLDRAAQKRMASARAAEQRAQATLDRIAQDPAGALASMGPQAIKGALRSLIDTQDPSARAAVQEVFEAIVSESQWTPEQRLEHERGQFAEQRRAWEQQRTEARHAAMVQQAQPVIEGYFQDALKACGLEGDSDAMEAMIDAAMRHFRTAPQETAALTPDVAMALAKQVKRSHDGRRARLLERVGFEDLGDRAWDYLRGLDPATMVERLGEEKWAALREHAVKQAQKQQSAAHARAAKAAKIEAPQRPLTIEEVRAQLDAKRRARG